MSILVVIPTYNEIENIADMIERVQAAVPEGSILVVDDASPDGTGALADSIAERDSRVQVLHRAGKEGLGAAYIEAFGWALERDYDFIVQIDADGSHRPEHLPAMLRRAEHADLVVGSRWVPGGEVVNWPWHRKLISRGGSFYARTLLRLKTRDATAGYKVFKADTLRRIGLDSITTKGYGFQVDVLWNVERSGLVVVEEPITFIERERGNSKMSSGIVFEAMFRVTRWGLSSIGKPRVTKSKDSPAPAPK